MTHTLPLPRVHSDDSPFMRSGLPLTALMGGAMGAATSYCRYGTKHEMGPDNPQGKPSHGPAFLHG
jgi:hypothetical protein